MITITNITDLQKIGNDPGYLLSDDYELGNNIDASATSGWNGGLGFLPIGSFSTPFTGTFDGKGYVIDGLYIHRTVTVNVTEYVGLFAVTSGAEIKNFSLINCDIECTALLATPGDWYSRTGTIIGEALTGSIVESISSTGTVSTAYSSGGLGLKNIDMKTGGLIGKSSGDIDKCHSSCTMSVDGVRGTGGFIGQNDNIISNSNATGNITAVDTGGGSEGDIAGFVWENSGSIGECYCSGNLIGIDDIGGFVFNNLPTGVILNCYSISNVTGTTLGDSSCAGFCGWENEGTIQGCYCTGAVIGRDDSAGFVRRNEGTITCCRCTGDVSTDDDDIGGFVNTNTATGVIEKCWCSGNITNTGDDSGGFVQSNSGNIRNCYCTGDINSSDDAGGFADSNSGIIENCYCTSAISGSDVGGFCEGNSGTITSCYWDTNTSGVVVSDGGTGKTTAQMKQQATYSGWQFDIIWSISEGISYPKLGPGCITSPGAGEFVVVTLGANPYLKKLIIKDPIITENTSFVNNIKMVNSFGISDNLDIEVKNMMVYCKNADIDFSPNDPSINLYGYGLTVKTPGVFKTAGPSSLCSLSNSAISADSLSDT